MTSSGFRKIFLSEARFLFISKEYVFTIELKNPFSSMPFSAGKRHRKE
jgi:hypothetical protein